MSLRGFLWVITTSCVLMATAMAVPPSGYRLPVTSSQVVDYHMYVNANNLLGFVSNKGVMFSDEDFIFERTDGLYFPYSGVDKIGSGELVKTVIYRSGLWLGGKVGGQIRVALSDYDSEYWPGPMVGTSYSPDGLTNGNFRVYKIFADSAGDNPNADYLQWPTVQGAPTSGGVPALLGDQVLFPVYNDANPAEHYVYSGSTAPLGIEIRQTVWASEVEDGIIYVRYDLHNKGGQSITEFNMGIWADPDLGTYNDDLVGCDTLAGVFYCYNGDAADGVYGSTPPAVGLSVVQGPIIPAPGDTAYTFGQTRYGYRNLEASAFCKLVNGADPSTSFEVYSLMNGLQKTAGGMMPYHFGPITTTFQESGDPISGTGDLDSIPGDRRMMLSTGPFDFAPGDSQQVIIKWGVVQGANYLASVTALKQLLANNTPPCCEGTTGNVDRLGIIDLADLSWLVAHLTVVPHPALPCADAGNVDGTGITDLTDLSLLVAYLTVPAPGKPALPNCP